MRKRARIDVDERRKVLRGLAASGAGVLFLGACGSGGAALTCAGSGQLTRSQKAARDGRKYTEISNVDGKTCANCVFFSSAENGCGTCGIDSLPANPGGYCTSWVRPSASAGNEE